DGPINAVALGADGGLVAAAAKTAVHVWNTADGTAAFTIARAADAVALAPGGARLATGGADGTVQGWRRNREKLCGPRSGRSAVLWVAFGSHDVLVVPTAHWLHSFSVGSRGLEPLHSWPAPGSLSAPRGLAMLGAEQVRVEGFDARGELRRSDIDLAVPRGN